MARRLGTGVKEMKDAVEEMDPRSMLDPKDEPAKPQPRRPRADRGGRAARAPAAAPAALRAPAPDVAGRQSRPRADGRRQLRGARAVHDQGRLHDPRVPPLAGAVPRRGDARARARRRRATTTRSPRRSTSSSAGGGTMELDGEVREVGEGDAILIPPGAWHELRAGPDGAAAALLLRAAVLATTTRISSDGSECRRPACGRPPG